MASLLPPSHAFTHVITVAETDIDEMGHVNNVVYVRWVQEVSVAHWAQAAPPEIKEKYLWVVLRHEVDFLKPAFLETNIMGYTWVGDHAGAKFDRFVQLYNAETNELLAKAKTTWCLLDAATLRPKRIEKDVLDLL